MTRGVLARNKAKRLSYAYNGGVKYVKQKWGIVPKRRRVLPQAENQIFRRTRISRPAMMATMPQPALNKAPILAAP